MDILIVEDGESEQKRLSQLFLGAGYTVACCTRVSEAENYLREQSFRLVFLDIGLEDKSGSFLFNFIKRENKVPFVIVYTGNQSAHLKQRLIAEGAIDYIIKGSTEAQNENLLPRVVEILGAAGQSSGIEGNDLKSFLSQYVSAASRSLFYEGEGDGFPACTGCKGKSYLVSFKEQPQIPPDLKGVVICSSCGKPMDPEIN